MVRNISSGGMPQFLEDVGLGVGVDLRLEGHDVCSGPAGSSMTSG